MINQLDLLPRPFAYKKRRVNKKIVFSDVDGTLTDGTVIYNDNGTRARKFSVIDGHGFQMLRDNGFDVVMISGEDDDNIRERAKKLDCFFLPCNGDRKEIVAQTFILFNYDNDPEIYAIGDDVNDLGLMDRATMCATPFGSKLSETRSDIPVLSKKGGEGAFREFAELVLLSNKIHPYEGKMKW